MKGLIVDTTVKNAYVVAFNGENTSVVYLAEGLSTASAIIPAVRAALVEVGLRNEDLDGVSAVVGPGSFTGIRIGVSFINAFAFALGVPRFRITSFDVMRALKEGAPAYAVDAGHDSYYAECMTEEGYIDSNVPSLEMPVGTVYQSDIIADLPKGAFTVLLRALDQHVHSLCAPSFHTDLLRPYYMRKSQAERMKEAHD